jgi:hypothetical protein
MITAVPQIEPSELVTKYTRHPELIDIFVEGEFDKDFLLSYLEPQGKNPNATIIPIDYINIKSECGNSNKEAVISLAKLIGNELKWIDINSIFIVDADGDRINNRLHQNNYLHYTDFTCMEMYFYNPTTLKRFLSFTCNLSDKDREEFVFLAEVILPHLFTARLVSEKFNLKSSIPSFSTGLKTKGDLNTFIADKYLTNLLSAAKNTKDQTKIKSDFLEIYKSLPADLRHKANGHDFISLLFEFLWRKRSLKLHNKGEDVTKFGGRILGSALNNTELSESILFKRLNSKLI